MMAMIDPVHSVHQSLLIEYGPVWITDVPLSVKFGFPPQLLILQRLKEQSSGVSYRSSDCLYFGTVCILQVRESQLSHVELRWRGLHIVSLAGH
jgi:hypothetical protein